jgi:hypothetical protein
MIHRIIDSKQGPCANGALTIVITLPGVNECCNLWSHGDFEENEAVDTAKMHVDEVRQKFAHILRCLSAGSLNISEAKMKRPPVAERDPAEIASSPHPARRKASQ